MVIDYFKAQFRKEQVDALYGGTTSSVIASLLFATVINFTITPELNGIEHTFFWIFLIYGIAILRGVDAFIYFKTDKTNSNTSLFFIRFTISAILGGAGWGLMLWNFFPASPQENQIYLILFSMGIVAFATTSLSYHLGIALIFITALIIPIEVHLLLDDSHFYTVLSFLFPIFFLSQINGARRINKKYLDNIRIQIEYKEKEKEYKNLKYAIDQHNIVSITDTRGDILYANEKMREITQLSQEELMGANHRVLKSAEHSPKFWKYMYRTIAKGNVWKSEVQNINKAGMTYWVDSTVVPFMDAKGKPYEYISIRTDITKLKELEQQSIHEKDNALVRAKVAQILQGQNPLKERITKSLEVLSEDLELNLQDKLGIFLSHKNKNRLKLYVTQGDFDATPAEGNKCKTHLHSLCARAIYSGKLVISDHCFDNSNKDHACDVASHGHYIVPLLHHTKVLGVLFVYTTPVPNRQQARLDTLRFIGSLFGLAIANETIKLNLHQARKHALEMAQTKSDFLANMSHEIRTPMNGVLGMLDLLSDVELDAQSKGYVETAQGSAGMLLNVINDILDISKIESGKLHIERINFDLRKATEDTTELLSKLAHEKEIELLTFIPPDTKTFVEGDMLRIQQVINNLVSNAIKFTHQGEVSINISTVEESHHAVKLRFEIKDTGIGIAEKKQTALFQAFTQADTSTSRKYGGTGLGLAISKKLIEMMQGEIGLISKAGKGSTFWFELPFKVIPKTAVTYNSLDKLRILTIDDNKTNLMILNSYAESWGVTSVGTNTAEAGIASLINAKKQEQPFDVLLLDMQMPEVTGQEIATEIRNNPALKDLKIILLSSMGLDRDMNADGLYDLMLNKPIRQSQLYDAIATVQNKNLLLDNNTHNNSYSTEIYNIKEHPLKGKILFVDDSKVNQYVGKEFLSKLELDFDIVKNGLEAVNARKENHYDLILMDCQMPVMDGYEATREIRHYEKETRKDNVNVIALTANAMQGDREKCIDAGMDDYLTKPYTIETLHKALSLWLPQPLWLPEQEDTQPAETQSAPDSKNNGTLYNEPLHNNEPLLTNNIEKETNKEKLGKLEGEILFVDDSKVNQYVGKEILTKLGLDFEVVVNGLEAVNARKKGTFDLILMDCQMPIMDGYTATLEIRQYEKNQHQNRITIVALTANAMPGDREKCLNAGMDDYLAKPYTAQDLYNTLAPWIKKQEKVVDDTVGV